MLDQNKKLFSTCYLAPISYYSFLVANSTTSLERGPGDGVYIERYEHFQKQTYRNRANIYSPNGLLPIIIPLHYKNHTAVKDVRIAYEFNWQKQHWRALESAYRKSPYFEYYECDFLPFYQKRYEYLLEFNLEIQKKVLELLSVELIIQLTSSYEKNPVGVEDYREVFHPKDPSLALPKEVAISFRKSYSQVFSSKFGFLPNLSIVDVLFNMGPQAIQYLMI